MTPLTFSGVLGLDARRINCSPPRGIYESQGALKAATSADTANLVSKFFVNQSTVLTHFGGFCLHTVFYLIQAPHFLFSIMSSRLHCVINWPEVGSISRSTLLLSRLVFSKKQNIMTIKSCCCRGVSSPRDSLISTRTFCTDQTSDRVPDRAPCSLACMCCLWVVFSLSFFMSLQMIWRSTFL